jgi:hypothetical protein
VTETPHIASVPQISRPVGVRRRCCERRLTGTEEQDTIIINRSGRSTYLGKKSVLTSGATPRLRPSCLRPSPGVSGRRSAAPDRDKCARLFIVQQRM